MMGRDLDGFLLRALSAVFFKKKKRLLKILDNELSIHLKMMKNVISN
jgi:hypothetical protein